MTTEVLAGGRQPASHSSIMDHFHPFSFSFYILFFYSSPRSTGPSTSQLEAVDLRSGGLFRILVLHADLRSPELEIYGTLKSHGP